MNLIMVDPGQRKWRILHQGFQRVNRDVGQVLVINRVVLRALKKIDEIGHLESNQRLWVRYGFQSDEQITQVINMRENMSAQNQICRAPFLFYFFGIGSVEKLTPGRDPGLYRNLADVFRRFHAENVTTTLL